MSNEKKFTIGIDTKANTSGAEDAVEAIDKVVDKANEVEEALEPSPGSGLDAIPADAGKAEVALEEMADSAEDAGKAIDNAGKTPGIKRIPVDAKAAAGSIDALEGEVQALLQQLNKLPVGSQEFVAMAGKVRTAQSSLTNARQEAEKLAGVVGRRGNGGMAVLEFSRAFEDAQYGIRGVLNNLPGLIAMLGGGPGLAGVLSVLAVAGSVVWEVMSEGSAKAGDEAIDYLEIYKKLSAEFGNSALEIERVRGESFARQLGMRRDFEAESQRIANDALKAEQQRLKGEGSIAIATARLDLARLESELALATGEKAVKLAKEREASLKRIIELEKQAVELQRQAEEREAAAKVGRAQSSLDAANQSKASAADRSAASSASAQEIAERLALAIEARAAKLEQLSEDRRRAIEQQRETSDPLKSVELEGAINKLTEQIEAVAKTPGANESLLKVQREEALKAEEQAKNNLSKAAEEQQAAALALRTAAQNLANVRNSQAQDRSTEAGLGAINDVGAADQKREEAGQKTAGEVGGILTDIIAALGDAANTPGIQDTIAKVRSLAADGIQAGEQNEAQKLVESLVAKIRSKDVDTAKLMERIVTVVNTSVDIQNRLGGRIDELERRVKAIGSTIGGPNP